MLKRHGASFVALGLGALGGCHEPVDPLARDYEALFKNAETRDSLGGEGWRRYLQSASLHKVWAPDAASPWRPYYRPTLPAAVSIVASAARPVYHEDSTEARVDELSKRVDLSKAAIFLDLPGEDSVAWGARCSFRGFQPVATFNNWPHARGILKLERPLGALIYYAAEMERSRPAITARPAFLLEGTRLQAKRMPLGPDEFDNRYFHVGADFPSANQLTAAGIKTIVYVRPDKMSTPCEDDLVDYFLGLSKSGLKFQQVTVSPGLLAVTPWEPSARSTIFTPELTQSWSNSSRTYGRSYGHYHGFWRSHQGTWGSRSSGGGGGSYS
jgi:hypothetical protein